MTRGEFTGLFALGYEVCMIWYFSSGGFQRSLKASGLRCVLDCLLEVRALDHMVY